MPTYDYLCPNGHRFEVIHSVTADGPERCVVCGASPVRKAFTAPTIHFKGSGWAKKDRSDAGRTKAAAKSDRGAVEKGAAGTTAPAEARPADSPAKKTTEAAASGAGGSTAAGAVGPASAD